MAKKKQGNFFKAARKCWPLYLMTLPGLIYLFVNNYMPMFGLVLAFKQYNVRKGIWGSYEDIMEIQCGGRNIADSFRAFHGLYISCR